MSCKPDAVTGLTSTATKPAACASRHSLRLVEGRHQHGGRHAIAQHRAQLLQGLHAVPGFHLPVDEDDVEAAALVHFGLQVIGRGRAAGQGLDLEPEAAQPVLHRADRFRQVVDQHRAQVLERRRGGALAGLGGLAQPRGEPEGAAQARLALDADRAAHQPGRAGG